MRSPTPLRLVLAALAVALVAGCTGGSRTMRPKVAEVQAGAAGETATSCAGDVCFTYADER